MTDAAHITFALILLALLIYGIASLVLAVLKPKRNKYVIRQKPRSDTRNWSKEYMDSLRKL